MLASRWKMKDLIDFHTRHKLQLLAHSPDEHRALGRVVAEGSSMSRDELRTAYSTAFMDTLARPATRGRNANVLNHAAGHLKEGLDSPVRQEIAGLITDYRKGIVPLIVPVTLIAHYARRLDIGYLLGQTYLEPHPKELMLRNH